jgi:hypothetical protein
VPTLPERRHTSSRDLNFRHEDIAMLYAILCYDSEDVVGAWTKEQDEAAITKLAEVTQKLAEQKRLGPVARLLPTTSATTVRKGQQAMVIDGPFAETKEQLLGFYVVDCASLEAAIETARDLARASSSMGSFELRPLAVFLPGGPVA